MAMGLWLVIFGPDNENMIIGAIIWTSGVVILVHEFNTLKELIENL